MSESTSKNSFNAKSTLEVAGNSYEIFEITGLEGAATLPFSLKVLLENLLRTEDGANITASQIKSLAQGDPTVEPDTEIQFTPARVIMQDFTEIAKRVARDHLRKLRLVFQDDELAEAKYRFALATMLGIIREGKLPKTMADGTPMKRWKYFIGIFNNVLDGKV